MTTSSTHERSSNRGGNPFLIGVFVLLACGMSLGSAGATDDSHMPVLFDPLIETLETSLFKETLPDGLLERVIDEATPRLEGVSSLEEERQLAFEMLSKIPLSHLGLVSQESLDGFMADLSGQAKTTLGMQLVRYGEHYYAGYVLEGGPAAQAGILRSHRVLAINGQPPGESDLLDFRTDDAALPDPPVHSIAVEYGQTVELLIEEPGQEERIVSIEPRPYSSLEAARQSVTRLPATGGSCLGYVHFWYIHFQGIRELLVETFEDQFRDCGALVLDLRGRGGSPMVVYAILALFEGEAPLWDKPVVALLDRNSRSAKDVLAYELKKRKLATLVGERSAGAVLPATFQPLAEGVVLMYPSFQLASHSPILEGNGVEPHVEVTVEEPLPPGSDPILERGLEVAQTLLP